MSASKLPSVTVKDAVSSTSTYDFVLKMRYGYRLQLSVKLKKLTHIWVWYGILSLNCIGLESERKMDSFNNS